MKKHAPATLRNRDAIAQILERELPVNGTVLEIASGSGEHALFFAERFPDLVWQPSDPDPAALASIAAYRDEYAGSNLAAPMMLDAAKPSDWPVDRADAVFCCNMTHISPWEASAGLFAGVASLAKEAIPPIILYGPYFERGIDPAPSNLAFDESLRTRDARWGIRYLDDMDGLARAHGLTRSARFPMPANNLIIVYR